MPDLDPNQLVAHLSRDPKRQTLVILDDKLSSRSQVSKLAALQREGLFPNVFTLVMYSKFNSKVVFAERLKEK